MATIITKGDISCHINTGLCPDSDGLLFIVEETGYNTTSEQLAINNALAYIKRQRRALLRGLNRQRKKLHKMALERLPVTQVKLPYKLYRQLQQESETELPFDYIRPKPETVRKRIDKKEFVKRYRKENNEFDYTAIKKRKR